MVPETSGSIALKPPDEAGSPSKFYEEKNLLPLSGIDKRFLTPPTGSPVPVSTSL
jgi:hypothetical protein